MRGISAENNTTVSPLTQAKRFIINLLAPSDSVQLPQMVLRAEADERQVVSHQVGGYLVTLSWQADVSVRNKFTLIGDVTPLDDDSAEFHGWTAHLWQHDQLLGQHPVGIDGDLLIDQLDRSRYHLVLTGDQFEAHLQNLQID